MAQLNLDTLPRGRKEAQALGSKHYFTGKPCKRGHLAERWTCNTGCGECKRESDRARTMEGWAPRPITCLECGAAMQTQLKPGRPSQFCRRECRLLATRRHKMKWEKANPEARRRQVRRRLEGHRQQRTATYLSWIKRSCRYNSERRKRDPAFRLTLVLRNRLWNALSAKGATKGASASTLTGCTVPELKRHLEARFKPGMSWDNWRKDGWHIDHIIPCASFDLTDPEQQKACFHYANLQPLWAEENLKKGARLAA